MNKFPMLMWCLLALLSWSCSGKRAFQPPIPAINPAFTVYEFNAEEGIELVHPGGTTISIPPNVLTDASGKPVNGRVSLHYREFHDALDVFASGIPMSYDSAAGRHHLQTAGMFQIEAWQADKSLSIASGRTIGIRFASFQPEEDYNFYKWDENANGWQFEQHSASEPNPEREQLLDSVRNARVVMPEHLMILHFGEALDVFLNYKSPQIYDQQIQKNFAKMLESYKVQVYKHLQVAKPVKLPGSCHTYPAYTLMWEHSEALDLPEWLKAAPQYERSGERARSFEIYSDCKPVANDSSGMYEFVFRKSESLSELKTSTRHDSIWQYNRKTKERRLKEVKPITTSQWNVIYRDKITASYTFRARPYIRIAEFLKTPPADFSEAYEAALRNIEAQNARIAQMAEVMRPMQLSRFGTYNYDRIYSNQDNIPVLANFSIGNQKPDLVYLISSRDKFVIRYHAGEWGKFAIPKDASARIFAVMPDYSVAYFPADEWNALLNNLPAKGSGYNFKLQTDADPIQTKAALERALQY